MPYSHIQRWFMLNIFVCDDTPIQCTPTTSVFHSFSISFSRRTSDPNRKKSNIKTNNSGETKYTHKMKHIYISIYLYGEMESESEIEQNGMGCKGHIAHITRITHMGNSMMYIIHSFGNIVYVLCDYK